MSAAGSPRAKRPHGSGTVSRYAVTAADGGERVLWRISYMEADATRPDVRRRRWVRGFTSEREAHERLEAIRVDMRRGDYTAPSRETLAGYAAEHFATIRVRASTLAGYRKHFRVHIEPALGGMRLNQITKTTLNRFYRELEAHGRRSAGHVGEPLGPATVRHVHVLLSQILAAAVDDGLIRSNPAKQASPPSKLDAAAPEMQTWSVEEMRAFLAWSQGRGDYLHLAWWTLLATGMRRGELLALRWRDVDAATRIIYVGRALSYVKEAGKTPVMSFTRPKSGRGRPIDVDSTLVGALEAQRRTVARLIPEFAVADGLIFPNRYGRPHNPTQFSRQWRERVAHARINLPALPTLHLHELRHTHATLLLRAGVHPKVVSERLGHASEMITLSVYSHAVPTLQRAAAETIGGMISA